MTPALRLPKHEALKDQAVYPATCYPYRTMRNFNGNYQSDTLSFAISISCLMGDLDHASVKEGSWISTHATCLHAFTTGTDIFNNYAMLTYYSVWTGGSSIGRGGPQPQLERRQRNESISSFWNKKKIH